MDVDVDVDMGVPGIDVQTEVRGIHGPPINVAAIERELANLWHAPSVVGLRQQAVVPTRTSVLNLVVFAYGAEQSARATGIISQLASSHPSRAIIFTLLDHERAFDHDIDAHVSTHCYVAGERFAPCFEQIEVTAPRDALELLPSIIRALALPDLPTFIWWPGRLPLGDRRFARIAEVADRLIVDSLDFAHCPANLVRLARQCRQLDDCCAISDLNWARLMPWRTMTAQFFDMPDARWALDRLRRVRLEYGRTSGAADNPVQALLLAGWLASRLGWRLEGRSVQEGGWSFTVRAANHETIAIELIGHVVSRALNGQLLAMAFDADDSGRDNHFELRRVGDDRSTVKMQARFAGQAPLERAMHAAPSALDTLLTQELRRRWHDRLYEDALHEASRFAAGLRERGEP